MQAAIGLFSAIGGAAGVGAAGAASAGAGILSAAVGGISAISAANYQAAVAKRAALVKEENARRIVEAGQKQAKDQDLAAAAAVADDIAAQASSGFSLSSPSFVRRRKSQTRLIEQDRTRIIEDANLQAQGELNDAATYRSEASQAKSSALFSFLEAGLNIGDSIIGGANLVSNVRQRRITNNSRYVGYA